MKSNLLRDAYKRNADRPVAYIDESMRGPHEPGSPYYILTAVVVAASDRDALRAGIDRLVGQPYWHTSDALKTGHGRQQAIALLTYLSQGSESFVISVNRSIQPQDQDLELARRECMGLLLPALEKPTSDRAGVRLAVAERRRDRSQQNIDSRTTADLVRAKAISQHFRLMQITPYEEHLLWLPDLVASAVRQREARGNTQMLNIVASRVQWV